MSSESNGDLLQFDLVFTSLPCVVPPADPLKYAGAVQEPLLGKRIPAQLLPAGTTVIPIRLAKPRKLPRKLKKRLKRRGYSIDVTVTENPEWAAWNHLAQWHRAAQEGA